MPRPFSEQFAELRGGLYDAEAGEKLAELCKAVAETGSAGSLTLKLTVKPNAERQIKFAFVLTDKIPRDSLGEAIMFVGEDGSLHRADPQQMVMFPADRGRPFPRVIDERPIPAKSESD